MKVGVVPPSGLLSFPQASCLTFARQGAAGMDDLVAERLLRLLQRAAEAAQV